MVLVSWRMQPERVASLVLNSQHKHPETVASSAPSVVLNSQHKHPESVASSAPSVVLNSQHRHSALEFVFSLRSANLRNAGGISSCWLLELPAALVEEVDNDELGCWLLSSCAR